MPDIINADMDEIKRTADFLEAIITSYMNTSARKFDDKTIHVTELIQCPRKAIIDRIYRAAFFTVDEYLAMLVGKGLHEYFGELEVLPGSPEVTCEHKFKIHRRPIRRKLIGSIDLVSSRGIYELKSVKQFEALVTTDEYENFDFSISYGRTRHKMPIYNHLDQLFLYLLLRNRRLGNIIYFSKKQAQGIAAYRIKYDPKDEFDLNAWKKNFNITRARMVTMNRGLDEVKNIDKKNVKEIVKLVNALPAEPSGLCSFCMFGGYASNSRKRGRKKNPNQLEKFFFEQGCDVSITDRKSYKKMIFQLPRVKYDGEIPSDGFVFDHSLVKKVQKKLAMEATKTIFKPYNYRLLLGCPRLTFYANTENFDEMLLSHDRSRRLIAYSTIRHALVEHVKKCLTEENNDNINVQVNEINKVLLYKALTGTGMPDPDNDPEEIAYDMPITIIDDVPTLIIPVTETSDPRIPYETHVQELILIKFMLNVDPQIIYFPTRTPQRHRRETGIHEAHIRVFRLNEDKDSELTKNVIEAIKKRMVMATTPRDPEVKVWCNWCPLLDMKIDGKEVCPEGNSVYGEGTRRTAWVTSAAHEKSINDEDISIEDTTW